MIFVHVYDLPPPCSSWWTDQSGQGLGKNVCHNVWGLGSIFRGCWNYLHMNMLNSSSEY